MRKGRCRLCRATRDLHDSHFFPRGGYKRMRAGGLNNPNPVVVAAGKLKQSSLQVRDYKFCGGCEGNRALDKSAIEGMLSEVAAMRAKS